MLGDQHRLEGAQPVARNTELELGRLASAPSSSNSRCDDCATLGRLAVEVIVHLGVQHPLRQSLLQLIDQPVLRKHIFGSRPASRSSSVSFLIAILALHRRHYGPTHKIPDAPSD